MRQRINPAWQREQIKKLEANRDEFEITTDLLRAAQWMIMALDHRGIPYRVIQLGAGVKKITTRTDVCPKCRGTGRSERIS